MPRIVSGAARFVWPLLMLSPGPAAGQVAALRGPVRAAESGEINLFVDWEGKADFEGIVIAAPTGWTVREARWVSEAGDEFALDRRDLPDAPGRTGWFPSGSLSGTGQIRFGVRVGAENAQARWAVVPYTRVRDGRVTRLVPQEFHRVARALPVEPARRENSNRVLRLTPGSVGPELDGNRIPDLSTSAAYTVEGWLRTTAVSSVVFSTWEGGDRSDYAAELVIDARGRAAFFQGVGGRHRWVRSAEPVADGTWHHVAVIHDPARGWTRLLVDGVGADSLYGFDAAGVPRPRRLAIGRRPGSSGGEGWFDGELDEFRVWAVARDARAVRSAVGLALPQPAAGAVVLSFDTPVPAPVQFGAPRRFERVSSDLGFLQPLRDLAVRFDGSGVRLSWAGTDPGVVRFVVERSADGRAWADVSSLSRDTGIPRDDERQYSFVDVATASAVAFYRVRQEYAHGDTRVSPAMKVGLGDAALPASIEGNYPNPFNPTTTIRYRVSEQADLTVSVWDLSGQLVRTLRHGSHGPGDYSVPFSADDLPSGTYFVRLETAAGAESHRMVLAR